MKYQQLQGQQCYIRRPSGVLENSVAIEARQNKDGLIRLDYVNGEQEFAPSPDKDLHDFPTWFDVVSFVQDARTKGKS